MYPWPGEFSLGDPEMCVAVATLSRKVALPADMIAIWGEVRTENIGVEKVVANCISNPNIRFLVLWGDDVRGHRSGDSLLALRDNGIDEGNRIRGSKGALPFIENLALEALERFQEQIEVIDMMGNTSIDDLLAEVVSLEERNPGPMDAPYMAIRIERSVSSSRIAVENAIAVHASLAVDPYGEMMPLEVH